MPSLPIHVLRLVRGAQVDAVANHVHVNVNGRVGEQAVVLPGNAVEVVTRAAGANEVRVTFNRTTTGTLLVTTGRRILRLVGTVWALIWANSKGTEKPSACRCTNSRWQGRQYPQDEDKSEGTNVGGVGRH